LGYINIPIAELTGGAKRKWFKLLSRYGSTDIDRGEVELDLHWTGVSTTVQHHTAVQYAKAVLRCTGPPLLNRCVLNALTCPFLVPAANYFTHVPDARDLEHRHIAKSTQRDHESMVVTTDAQGKLVRRKSRQNIALDKSPQKSEPEPDIKAT
jgi:hypothetical protein